MITRFLLGAAAVGAAGSAFPASAQTEPPAEVEAKQDEIVVTARRKVERLQDTPVAVTVITAAALEARNVRSVVEVAGIAPNVVFEPAAPLTGSTNNGSVFIRGIGTTEFSLGTEPGVGIYVDDVYLARTSGNVLNVIDVAAIEVLRGPQGTLFGRNSVGGAILLRSQRPAAEFAVKLTGEYGTDDLRKLSASVDIPITDALRTKFAIQRSTQDGYVRDVARIEDFGRKDSWSGRATVELQAASNLLLTGHFDYTRESNGAAPFVLIGLFDVNPGTGQLTSAALRNLSLGPACAAGTAGNAGGACVDQYYIRGKRETVFGYASNNRFINDFNKQRYQSLDFTEVFGGSLTGQWDLGAVSVKSITAYRTLESRNPRNADHTPFNVLEANSDLEQDQFSQELQLSGQGFDRRLDWIAGLFYMRETGSQLDAADFFLATVHSGGAFRNKSIAGFGQATYKIIDDLSLTAGLRYTREDKSFGPNSDDFVLGRTQLLLAAQPLLFGIPGATPASPKFEVDPALPLLTETTSLKTSQLTPHVDLAWKPSTDILLYGSYSRGYKAGGFEQRLTSPVVRAPTFDVETVDAFEIGFKSTFLDNSLRVNAAAFFTDYKALQCSVVIGFAPTIINCGDATIKGFEVETSWRPIASLTIDFGVGYTDARWSRTALRAEARAIGITPDSKFALVPEWTLSGSISYEIDLSARGSLTPRLDWSFKSEAFRDAVNTPILLQPDYHLVNLGLTWTSRNKRFSIQAIGRNMFNEQYSLAGGTSPDNGVTEAIYARGREVSVGAIVRF